MENPNTTHEGKLQDFPPCSILEGRSAPSGARWALLGTFSITACFLLGLCSTRFDSISQPPVFRAKRTHIIHLEYDVHETHTASKTVTALRLRSNPPGFGGPEAGTRVNLPVTHPELVLPRPYDLLSAPDVTSRSFELPTHFHPEQPLIVGDGYGNKSGLGGSGSRGMKPRPFFTPDGQGKGSPEPDSAERLNKVPSDEIYPIRQFVPNYQWEMGDGVRPGPVDVRVIVNAEGIPQQATAFSGNPMLWPISEKGALHWRFHIPTHLKPRASFILVIRFTFKPAPTRLSSQNGAIRQGIC